MDYKTLLLDVDGTLLDFEAGAKEALREIFQQNNYELNEEVKAIYGKINRELWDKYEMGVIDRNAVVYKRFGMLFERLGIEDDGITFEDGYQELLGMQHFFIEDALWAVQYLYEKYDLYIVTNGVAATQQRRLRESKLDQYMKGIFISDEVGVQKPRKEFFDYCFERINSIDLPRTMIIGDSLTSDMKGGNNAGITTCWYNPGLEVNNLNVKIDYEIRSLKELSRIL